MKGIPPLFSTDLKINNGGIFQKAVVINGKMDQKLMVKHFSVALPFWLHLLMPGIASKHFG